MIQAYVEHGWSLIPVEAGGKRPVGSWSRAQAERATPAEVDAWVEEELNLGVVTGSLSGVVVIDCDTEDAIHAVARLGMPITPTATSGRGRHYFVKHHPGIRNSAGRIAPNVDIRGEGGFVVIPPSTHPSGREYAWVGGLGLEDVGLAEPPAWLLRASETHQKGREDGDWTEEFGMEIPSGRRNHKACELAGYLLRRNVEPGVVDVLLQLWNERRCNPPMPVDEVRQVVKSISQREERRRNG